MNVEISVVTSMYNNKTHAEEFVMKTIDAIKKLKIINYEIIIVDDSSSDETFDILKKISLNNKEIKLIRLNKNCGQSFSLLTGFSEAKGKLIFTLDSDLEEDPIELVKFYQLLKSKNLDDVYGYTNKRKGGVFEKLSGLIFYKFANLFNNSEKKTDHYISSMRLFTSQVNQSFKKIKDRDIFFISVFQELNIKSEGLLIEKKNISKTGYTLNKKIKMFLDYLMLHANEKLLNISFLYVSVIFITLNIMGLYYLISYFVFDIIPGFTSIILSIWIFGSLTLILNIFIINFLIRLYKIQNSNNDNHISKKINFD